MMMELTICILAEFGVGNCNVGEPDLLKQQVMVHLFIYQTIMKPALCAKVARLTDDLLEFAEDAKDVVILDENGKPLLAG